MFSVGLTGGICSGKSAVSRAFDQLGVEIIDTDIISRQFMEIDQPAYIEIRQKYGSSILQEQQELDRKKLREIIFSDPLQKQWLEELLHPLIYQETQNKIQSSHTGSYAIVVVPLLIEAGYKNLVDRILVVNCSRPIQIERLMKRDNIDRNLALQMISQQLSNSQRLEYADDVLDNQSNLSNLQQQVLKLDSCYRQISDTALVSDI
ncbi:MAG: dephospho-CoA kinase [Gammaproteobacteria bacterium]|jgi:dephospho-CoA kinase